MKIKKGDVFYEAWINLEIEIGEKSTVEYSEWHVTCVDKRGVFFRQKDSLNYGKVSKKQGDYGWLPWDNWTRQYSSKKCTIEELELKLKRWNFKKSKSAAYRTLLPKIKKAKKDVLRLYSQIERVIKKASVK